MTGFRERGYYAGEGDGRFVACQIAGFFLRHSSELSDEAFVGPVMFVNGSAGKSYVIPPTTCRSTKKKKFGGFFLSSTLICVCLCASVCVRERIGVCKGCVRANFWYLFTDTFRVVVYTSISFFFYLHFTLRVARDFPFETRGADKGTGVLSQFLRRPVRVFFFFSTFFSRYDAIAFASYQRWFGLL